MIAGLSSPRVARVLAAALLLVILCLPGCESEQYSDDLQYPMRADVFVVKAPTTGPGAQPFAPDPPGRLDEQVAGLVKLGGKTLDLNGKDPKGKDVIPAALKPKLGEALVKVFGRPAVPKLGAKADLDEDAVETLRLDRATLARGSVLYRRNCLTCHGLTGDGRGPTGPWVNPHPRDYRAGKFKFVSSDPTLSDRKPRRDDLLRVLHTGIEGTTMPSFALLPEEDLQALISYVVHLSVRGQTEILLLQDIANGSDYDNGEGLEEEARSKLKQIVGAWDTANKGQITPASYPPDVNLAGPAGQASIQRGFEIFSDPKGEASCIGCHLDYGRQAPFRYDEWGTLVRPANLTTGMYRGGRRPIDLFWRVKGGIPPSGMPKTGLADKTDKDGKPRTADQQVWDVVNFVQALPYPRMLPEDVRYKVYDRPGAESEEKTAGR